MDKHYVSGTNNYSRLDTGLDTGVSNFGVGWHLVIILDLRKEEITCPGCPFPQQTSIHFSPWASVYVTSSRHLEIARGYPCCNTCSWHLPLHKRIHLPGDACRAPDMGHFDANVRCDYPDGFFGQPVDCGNRSRDVRLSWPSCLRTGSQNWNGD